MDKSESGNYARIKGGVDDIGTGTGWTERF